MTARGTIGIDVGGTKMLAVALAEADGGAAPHGLAEAATPTPTGGNEAVVAGLVGLIERLVGTVELAGIGVGLPGLVSRAGVLRLGPNLAGAVDLDVATPLRERFGVPVAVDNDGNLAALAEVRAGAARGRADVVFVGLGTGISAGFVVDGSVWRGGQGFAGEPGHATLVPDGTRCACGRRGCWEAYASGEALGRLARDQARAGRVPTLVAHAGVSPGELRGEHVTRALVEGDPGAALVIRLFARWVGLGLANLATTLDPEVVVLGGSMIEVGEPLVAPIRAVFEASVLHRHLRPGLTVLPAQLGRQAGAVGAALVARSAAVD